VTWPRLSGILPIPRNSDPPLQTPHDLDAWLRLTLIPGVSARAQQKLLRELGTPQDVLGAPVGQVQRVVGSEVAAAFARGAQEALVARAKDWLATSGRHFIALSDAQYPRAWLDIDSPPTAFYAVGDPAWLSTPAIAVVGSRNATAQGVQDAQEFSRALCAAGLTIVSGLAHGIDAAAHRGALGERGSTVAVMGTGADRIYPRANATLAHEIADKGCLVSEFPLGTGAIAANFPQRNRLISGLAGAVLVVQAAEESGSLITARYAAEQGRDVFAIPGSIHSPLAKGCHLLIKQGAKLVDRVEDILAELGLGSQERLKRAQMPSHPLLRAMGFEPLTVDEIIARTGGSAASVAAQLSELEVDGRVEALAGGRFQQLAAR
jgi:DNA processing protein